MEHERRVADDLRGTVTRDGERLHVGVKGLDLDARASNDSESSQSGDLNPELCPFNTSVRDSRALSRTTFKLSD